jgi:hypothetical protein
MATEAKAKKRVAVQVRITEGREDLVGEVCRQTDSSVADLASLGMDLVLDHVEEHGCLPARKIELPGKPDGKEAA